MLSLNTNTAALSTQGSLAGTQKSLSTSMTRLGTGLRINSAMDDAAGLQIAARLNAQVSGMAVAQRNTQNGISMLQTGEGALSEVTNILTRMKDLATESATASTTTEGRTALQAEYDSLGLELYNIASNTTFGGNKLLVGGTMGNASLTFQIGAEASEQMTVDLKTTLTAVDTALKAVSKEYGASPAAGTEVTTATAANGILSALTTALDAVGKSRGEMGAAANRLDHVYNNLQNISTNVSAAKGRIMDTDYATESSNMTSKQMLMQASSSMLKQANSMSSLVMSLLQ